MKKLVMIMWLIIMTCSIVACGGEEKNEKQNIATEDSEETKIEKAVAKAIVDILYTGKNVPKPGVMTFELNTDISPSNCKYKISSINESDIGWTAYGIVYLYDKYGELVPFFKDRSGPSSGKFEVFVSTDYKGTVKYFNQNK